jgi:AraC-like DNA-binding protein
MDTHVEPHQHPWSQLTYCASGLMQVIVTQGARETTFIVPPSRAVWISPQVQHSVVVLEAAELRTVYIAPGALPASWSDSRVLLVSKLLREVIHALDGSEPGTRDNALMALALDEIARANTQALGVPMPHPEYGDKRLRNLCEAVLRNPAAHAKLKAWGADVGASERTVARLFRDELGTTYQQWRTQVVLAHALPQLVRGTPIADVAANAGYTSDSAFSAMFKQAMGHAPSYFQTKTATK